MVSVPSSRVHGFSEKGVSLSLPLIRDAHVADNGSLIPAGCHNLAFSVNRISKVGNAKISTNDAPNAVLKGFSSDMQGFMLPNSDPVRFKDGVRPKLLAPDLPPIRSESDAVSSVLGLSGGGARVVRLHFTQCRSDPRSAAVGEKLSNDGIPLLFSKKKKMPT